ncbi:MAG: ribose 5-phosphate isomerase A [Sulfolobales archaeon]|nr:ribose 5-phosphate isomerase A [Sulfolobales archaeon]MDW8082626.1 ribose 5-phosphate isomerase A [Sulfolobales archaeon]
MSGEIEVARRSAAIRVLEHLDTAEVVGLGTGSTIEIFLKTAYDKLARKTLVTSSIDTTLVARSLGLKLVEPLAIDYLDLYVDSADEVDPLGRMVKGGGGAMTMEKILASAANLRVFVVDELKVVPKIPHSSPVPIEVVPQAISIIKKKIESAGFACRLRVPHGKRAPVITDLGGAVIDTIPPKNWEPEDIARFLESIPGVVGHGIFINYTDILVIGRLSGQVEVVSYRR